MLLAGRGRQETQTIHALLAFSNGVLRTLLEVAVISIPISQVQKLGLTQAGRTSSKGAGLA